MDEIRIGAVRPLRALVALAVVLIGLGLFTGRADAETGITVETTPAENQDGFCDAPEVSSSDAAGAFSVSIVLTAPSCLGPTATAAVYAMPPGGGWPQKLVEATTFPQDAAGTTVVTFAKGCDPEQFDVIIGAAPPTLNTPLDAPVLTPLAPNQSALQWLGGGENCGTTTTTTTTIRPQLPVTPPPAVQGATTVPTTAPITAATVRVAAVSVQAATTAPSAPAATALALTGARPGSAMTVGALLLAAGLVLSMMARQTRSRRTRY